MLRIDFSPLSCYRTEQYLFGFYFPSIAKTLELCYTIFATQLNIWTNYGRRVFIFGKNAFSILTFSCSLSEVVSQQAELCVFRCV